MVFKLASINANYFNRKWSAQGKWVYNFGTQVVVKQIAMPPPGNNIG